MTNIRFTLIFLFLFSIVHSFNLLGLYEDKTRDEWEDYLRSSEIINVEKDLEMGRTDFWKVTLDDGKLQKKAVFKYVNRYRPHRIPDSYKYEIAAYILDKLLNLNMVPPTVKRDVEGQSGSLQLFLTQDDLISEEERTRKKIEPSHPEDFQHDLQNLDVFEILTYLSQRQLSDIKIDLKSWQIFRLDFSEAFEPAPSLLANREITGCSKDLYMRMKKLDVDILHKQLSEYLNEEELKSLEIRLKLVVGEIDRLINEKGEGAVLFNE